MCLRVISNLPALLYLEMDSWRSNPQHCSSKWLPLLSSQPPVQPMCTHSQRELSKLKSGHWSLTPVPSVDTDSLWCTLPGIQSPESPVRSNDAEQLQPPHCLMLYPPSRWSYFCSQHTPLFLLALWKDSVVPPLDSASLCIPTPPCAWLFTALQWGYDYLYICLLPRCTVSLTQSWSIKNTCGKNTVLHQF